MDLESKPIVVKETLKIYSPEKNQRIKDAILNLRLNNVDTSKEVPMNQEESIFMDRVRSKYTNPGVDKYAMWHAYGGSTINPKLEAEILFDDFPGEDSVEKFVNYLVGKYQ